MTTPADSSGRSDTSPRIGQSGKSPAPPLAGRDLGERGAAEAELRESLNRYQSLIETTSDFIWEMDASGRYTYCSPQMETLWGLQPAEMIGKTPFDLMPPDQRSAGIEAFAALLKSPQPFNLMDIESYDGRGRLICLEISGVPFFDDDGNLCGFRGISRDITERKKAETALRASQREAAAVLESISDGFFSLDADWTFRFINGRAAGNVGYRPAQLLGKNIWDLFPRMRGTEMEATFRRVMEERTPRHFAFAGRLTEGQYEIRVYPGGETGISVYWVDTTEASQAHEAIARRNALLSGISRIFREALVCENEEALGHTCLAVAEEVTGSKFGFIGELNAEGKLDDVAISDPGWEVCRMVPSETRGRVPVGFRVHGIYGRVLLDGRGFFTNDPGSHPDSIGLPVGHPPLRSFLGVPLISAGKTTGMVAVGNREGGYREEDLVALESLAPAIVEALQRRRAEETLRETTDYLEKLLAYANAPVIVWDPALRITRFNHAFEHLTGYEAQEVVGQDLSILFPPDSREQSLVEIAATSKGEHWESVEIPIQRKDGGVRLALWNSANVYAKDGQTILATIAQGQDITDRKRAEAERERLLISEREARTQAEEAVRERDEFLSVAAHELKTPITSLRGYAQTMLRRMKQSPEPDPERSATALLQLDRQSERLANLVNQLLDLSRLDAGRLTLQRHLADVTAVVEEPLARFRALHPGRDFVLRARAPLEVLIDPLRLEQVIVNLLDNAVKFSPPGTPVEVDVQRPAGGPVVIAVRDHGSGVAPADRERVFERFRQAHDDWHGGLGLGLFVSRQIVELHGGTIDVESSDDGGSRFVILLPAEPEDAPGGSRRSAGESS